MILQAYESEFKDFETKYPCIICLERVKSPVTCIRCNNMMCLSHTRKIGDKCPYCRLTPFVYQRDKFMEQLIQIDKKRQQEFLIQTANFTCLVQGCGFQGKFHKMDIHRRKAHRNQTLKEIIFSQQRQKAKKMKAIGLILNNIKKKNEQTEKWYKLAIILKTKSRDRMSIQTLVDMLKHVSSCGHNDCKKVFIQETMSFVGNNNKEISNCQHSQRFLTFY